MNTRRLAAWAVWPAVLVVASVLLVGASANGQAEFDRAAAALSTVSWFNSEMNGAVLRLRSHLNEGFDRVTTLQLAQRELIAELETHPDLGPLGAAIQADAVLVDDFKANHAVFRNSLFAIHRLTDDLRALASGRAVERELLGQLESAVLRYSSIGAPEHLTAILAASKSIAGEQALAAIKGSEDWALLLGHANRIMETTPTIAAIESERAALDVDGLIGKQFAAARARHAERSRVARYYLYALFALALFLVGAVVVKIAEIRRYVAAIQRHGKELEARVAERTFELEGANERLKAEAVQREQMQADLLQARKLESVGQLAAGVAHEINTPIQYVGDNVRFLQGAFTDLNGCIARIRERARGPEGLSDHGIDELLRSADVEFLAEEAPRAISQSLDGVKRVSEIVQAMKAFAHPSNTIEPADLNGAIKSSVAVSRNEWKYVAETVLEFDEGLPMVPCAVGAIGQVIVNMIINAAHAIGDAAEKSAGGVERPLGRITIRTRAAGEFVEIDIEDTGTGMSAETQARIFDPFFTTKPVGKGTGQGLAIAHRIVVERHHGKIGIRSSPGHGTCFTIRLPVRRAEAA